VDVAGERSDPPVRLSGDGPATAADLVWAGNRYAVVWQEVRNLAQGVYLTQGPFGCAFRDD